MEVDKERLEAGERVWDDMESLGRLEAEQSTKIEHFIK